MASSNRSSPDSSTSTRSSAVTDHGFGSRPKEAEDQTESGFGEGPSFQVSEQVAGPNENDTTYGGTSGSQIHVPLRVGTSFKALRVEGNVGFSTLFDDASVPTSPRRMGGYPIPVENEDKTELHSEECQGYERLIKKAATVSLSHESAGYTKYLIDMNKKLDNNLYKKEQLLKKFERRIKDLQLQTHLKEIEIESLRQQMADTEEENDDCQLKIKSLEREVEWLNFQSDEEKKKRHSFKLPQGDSPREQLAIVEKQLETLQQKIQKLEDENSRKDAEISRLQAQNAVTEVEAVRLEKEKTAVIIKEKDDELEVVVESLYQLIIEKGFGQQSLHLQMSQKSDCYAHFFKERAESVAALHLEAPHHLSFSAASVHFQTKGSKTESISTPAGADPVSFEVGGRSPFGNADLSIASELDGIQESSSKRSSVLAVNSYSMEIPSHDLVYLADFFDCVDFLVDLLELTPSEKSDAAKKGTTQTAVHFCLSCWKKREPEKATFQALLGIVRKLKRGDIVRNIETYFRQNY